MDYGTVFQRLSYELAIIKFIKKDGTERVMLGTRNIHIGEIEHGNLIGLLNGHDKRCNIKNGNLAVIDMMLGECRCFNIERVIEIKWLGEINNRDEYDRAYEEYYLYKQEEENKDNGKDTEISLDTL